MKSTEFIPLFVCEDCMNEFFEKDGRYYKYEQGVWLCDDCEAERMDDES